LLIGISPDDCSSFVISSLQLFYQLSSAIYIQQFSLFALFLYKITRLFILFAQAIFWERLSLTIIATGEMVAAASEPFK
jgi:hypothetical protein